MKPKKNAKKKQTRRSMVGKLKKMLVDFLNAATHATGFKMKLDKSKSYAQIFGSTDGSRFEQGGVLFDFEGNELNAVKPSVVQVQSDEGDIIEPAKRRGRPPKGE